MERRRLRDTEKASYRGAAEQATTERVHGRAPEEREAIAQGGPTADKRGANPALASTSAPATPATPTTAGVKDKRHHAPYERHADTSDGRHTPHPGGQRERAHAEPGGGDRRDDSSSPSPDGDSGRDRTPPLRGQPLGPGEENILGADFVNFSDVCSLHDELGAGAFGTTYLAVSKSSGEEMACKVIPKHRLLDEVCKEGLRQEVKILRHLTGHPNIAGLKGAHEDAVNVYILMEICVGGELFARIAQRGHYSEKDAADCFRTIMKTVAHCHDRGVFHRDLKPENFVLETSAENASIKAIDFGLSTFFTRDQKFSEVVGTSLYMAPEVIDRNYSQGADVWSAGVILYILLSGNSPFWAPTDAEVLEEVKKPYDLVSDPWHKVSDAAKEVIRMCLNPDPSTRKCAKDVLLHRWVRENGSALREATLDGGVLARMKNFASANKFKKMGLMAMAKTLCRKDSEMMRLKRLFTKFDTDDDGAITVDELRSGLEKTGALTGASELKQLVHSLDIKGTQIPPHISNP